MRRLLSLVGLLALSVGVPLSAEVVIAGPASAATCGVGDVVLVDSSFAPNPVVRSSTPFENDVTLTNCTNTTQSVTYGGTITAPSTCGNPPFDFGPIPKTLTANQVVTYTQPIDPAPGCTGTYSQYIEVDQGGTMLDSETVTFTVV